MELTPALYLIPVEIGAAKASACIPPGNLEIVRGIRTFVVENLRTARRCLRHWDPSFPIDECTFFVLPSPKERGKGGAALPRVDRVDKRDSLPFGLDVIRRGGAVGVMSEAGCPAVADPGSEVVAAAQRAGLRVIPLVGPSSILLSLMASGFNGQGFAFTGYLPVKDDERLRALKDLEGRCARWHQTQIFIETPYRNNRLLAFLANHLRPDTLLCVAADISDPDYESIITRPAADWLRAKYDYDKRPAIFLIHRN